MSDSSYHLSMPYIQGGQAQKHVTHNEAIRTLDTIVQLSVLGQFSAPTGSEANGDRVIVAAGATGDFTAQDGHIAVLDDGFWGFTAPKLGWTAFDQSSGIQIVFDGVGWSPVGSSGSVNATDRIGINASADSTNRLASAADATLLTHDIGGGHQLKVNKASASDTASLLFQTGWAGRAEMGTAGSDNFSIKVSADGNTFLTGVEIDAATGSVSFPNTDLADPAFGGSTLITSDFAVSRGSGMVTNGTGYLGNSYNFPPEFSFDASETPNLSGAFAFSGHYVGDTEMTEFVPIDPNRVYRLGCYLRQASMPGDWSGFADEERHSHYIGFRCYDVDGHVISAGNHMRFRHSGVDSLTTLTQALAPGDTVVHVADASGWNQSSSNSHNRGLVIFEYKNSMDRGYEFYSRITDINLFDLGSVDKTTHQITLNKGLPSAMANPDHPEGIWPVGTRIANRATGWNYKFGFIRDQTPEATDTWYHYENVMGGVDLSGKNIPYNFPPGTATVRPVFLMNYSNRNGGFSNHPDTGADHKVWVSGLSIDVDCGAQIVRAENGSCALKVIEGDPDTGGVAMVDGGLKVSQI
ncbi:MAG: DUF2793 domain-containing protein [Paracoccaceae bacterium]